MIRSSSFSVTEPAARLHLNNMGNVVAIERSMKRFDKKKRYVRPVTSSEHNQVQQATVRYTTDEEVERRWAAIRDAQKS